ncbi:uncharacterized protein LOC134275608 isoform X2 [Saccostrea cucullata]|uniref:uncharacterized protein LOC134275608 isoform X2 n=1 Tax=Saccostrea cuccullata TaxID=36930 RepID=UPI002ED38754
MKENGSSPSSPPEYSGPGEGGQDSPPSYDDIFRQKVSQAPKRKKESNAYIKDDRNIWEKFHECFEDSGSIFRGNCTLKTVNSRNSSGKTEEEHDMTTFIQAEGGVLCATVIFVLFFRVLAFLENRNPKHKSQSNIQETQICMGRVLFIRAALYVVNFALCIAGAARVIPAYTSRNASYKVECDNVFFSFYFYAKIVHLSVLMPYAAYILLSVFVMPVHQKRWLFRRKWRQWVRLIDADQDGVISADDMEKTNAKFEELRKLFGVRNSALSAAKQKKWWNDHIFKLGPGNDISVNDYIYYLEGTVGGVVPSARPKKVKPVVTGFFDFFSTGEYRKKSLIIGQNDFVKFWTILVGLDEVQGKKLFLKNFPAPFTMTHFMEDFVNFLSNDEFLDEVSYRVFNVLRHRESQSRCCDV